MRVEIVDPDRLVELRRAVLRPNLPPGSSFEPLDKAGAVHLGAVDDDGQIVGTCVIFPESCPERPDVEPAWQLRAMAVAPDRQGSGIGALVLRTAIDRAVRAGAALLWCNARTTAVPFYERHGFEIDGPEFLSPSTGIPHYAMWRELSGPPVTST